ncbi:prevent-host-death protein [Nocardia brasiliensis]|nr:prevent-host-death protein [Nocardia brasiliensis]
MNVDIRALHDDLLHYLAKVGVGQSLTVTEDEHPIAHIVPVHPHAQSDPPRPEARIQPARTPKRPAPDPIKCHGSVIDLIERQRR